ncbi:MAG: hypothetical protein ABDH28_04015 [Brevinematia bacterium]
MEKIKLPPEYKDFYHLKEEDIERLNRHIDYFEKEKKKRKIVRRWIFGGVILIAVVMFLFGVIDLSYFERWFKGATFLIKESIELGDSKVDIRISMPIEGMVNIIFQPSGLKEVVLIVVSNQHEVKEVSISKGIENINIKYDRRLFFRFNDKEKVVNIETLKLME